MSKNKLIGIVSSIILIISAWMPWFKVSFLGISTNGFTGGIYGNPGIFFVVIGILTALFMFIAKKWSIIVSIVLALVTLALSIKYYRDASSAGASAGFGIYAMMIGSIGIIIGSIMGFKKNKVIPTSTTSI